MKKSMQQKLETKLLSGAKVTVAQILKMGFKNPSDPIYKMRQAGYSVKREVTTTRNGDVSRYSLAA